MSETLVSQEQIHLANSLGLPKTTWELSKQQLGWLRLARDKQKTFDDLQKHELAVQAKLDKITEDPDLKSVQEKIKEAKEIAATAKEQRLAFTGLLNSKLIEPAMAFEKRNDALIKNAGEHELQLRKAAAEKEEEANRKNRELADLKAHITNEHYRRASEYRSQLEKMITDAFTTALRGKIPSDQIPGYLDKVRSFMAQVAIPPSIKFNRTLVSEKEAMEVYNSIKPWNPKVTLEQAYNDLEAKFSLYEIDLQNAELAAKAAEEEFQKAQEEQQEKLEMEQATNTLCAMAEVATVQTAKVKRSYTIIEENSPTWAMAVMSNFIKNFQAASTKVKVKTWGKLSILQMGEALAKIATDTGDTTAFAGLKFQVVEK